MKWRLKPNFVETFVFSLNDQKTSNQNNNLESIKARSNIPQTLLRHAISHTSSDADKKQLNLNNTQTLLHCQYKASGDYRGCNTSLLSYIIYIVDPVFTSEHNINLSLAQSNFRSAVSI